MVKEMVIFIYLGYGIFFYANGSKIEGHWKDNYK